MRKWGRIIGLLLVLWGSTAFGQELSQDVYPSEDELWEALRNGVITYEQYEVLHDLMEQGVDSTARFLLDQIPNLMYLMRSDSVFVDSLEAEQSSAFLHDSGRKKGADLIDGRLSYRYLMLVDDEDRSWYRGQIDLVVADHWRASGRLGRERSGRERVTSRSLGYRNSPGAVRRVDVGTFTTRLGLGSLFGHHGRVLDCVSGMGNEAWLNPACGGFNGVAIQLSLNRVSVKSLFSAVCDTTHRLTCGAVEVRSTGGHTRPGVVIGGVVLKNRRTGQAVEVPMASLLLDHDYAGGNVAVEAGRQWIAAAKAGSLIAEGEHRFDSAEVRYAVWHYGEGFVDLTSGGKSGTLYLADTLESVGLTYRSRRIGQSGAILKSAVPLNSGIVLANSLLHGVNSRDDNRCQLACELSWRAAARHTLRLAYLGDWRRETLKEPAGRADHQFRLEGRYDRDRVRVRCYIGYRFGSSADERAALFLSGRYRFADGTEYEVWSNCSKIGPDGLECWYLFGRGAWRLTRELSCGAKVIHSYHRAADESHATQLSLELTADL